VLLAGLLLIAAQLMSLVHAAEHPFHAHSEICVSFTSLEQHDTALAAASPVLTFSCLNTELESVLIPLLINSCIHSKPARGPPASARSG